MDKVVVIGAGASGVVSSIFAKNKNNNVTILEKNNKPLKKLLITGNGKCNYFNENFIINNYNSNNIDILKNIITEDNKNKLLTFFDSIGIVPKIKNGYYYPASNQAYSIYNSLLKEVELKNIELKLEYKVLDIKKIDNKFIIKTDKENIECDKLIISVGSKAYPKTGSEGDGYEFAKSLGVMVNKIYPALVSFTSSDKILKELDGVRTNVKVTLNQNNKAIRSEDGELQFTSTGLSGICIYNLSIHKLVEKNSVSINLLNDFNINNKEDFIREIENKIKVVKGRNITELLENYLNYKIVNSILKRININPNKGFTELSNSEKELLGETLTNLEIEINGTKDYDASQVCGGGISLEEININTFESKNISNLYFTGELLDVCGICGGYNLGFAFLSGMLAGMSVNND